ncbi:FixH family protein [Rhabdochromatium marinum]|uniref:FixH family protein n=1 Tax=Rhabdochromatium marinum TaxID=48729 RepID=UPI00190418D2|nr:FixH family protein [Rhabdochromatium marinum]MBK1650459.1 nitrogen fixation protein FixH [Rhabdochromatium marinum]
MTETAALEPHSAPTAQAAAASLSAWRSPWVIGWIGLISVVLLVNLTMVTLAVVTNPGLVVDDYYERGRAMERSIRSRATTTPGWTVATDIPPDLSAGQPATIRFFVVDQAGQPVTPETVTLFAYRPADAGRDFSLPMVPEAPGRYRAELSFPLPGVWDVLIAVTDGEAEYPFDQRLRIGFRRAHAITPSAER